MARTSINFTDDERALFIKAMKRDGMSQLTTWMKSVCSRYATGKLVAVPPKNEDDVDLTYLLQSLERMSRDRGDESQ